MVEHGEYSIVLNDRLLNVRLSGMFNELATQKVCNLIQQDIEQLSGTSFVMLLDCRTYEGSTPEAHKISNQFLLWLNAQSCFARAIVYSRKLYFDIVKNEQPALFGLQNRREFFQLSEANAWLTSQL